MYLLPTSNSNPTAFVPSMPSFADRLALGAVAGYLHYQLVRISLDWESKSTAILNIRAYICMHVVGGIIEQAAYLTHWCAVKVMGDKQTSLEQSGFSMRKVSWKVVGGLQALAKNVDRCYSRVFRIRTMAQINDLKPTPREMYYFEFARKVFVEILPENLLCFATWEIGRIAAQILFAATIVYVIPFSIGLYFAGFACELVIKISRIYDTIYADKNAEFQHLFANPAEMLEEHFEALKAYFVDGKEASPETEMQLKLMWVNLQEFNVSYERESTFNKIKKDYRKIFDAYWNNSKGYWLDKCDFEAANSKCKPDTSPEFEIKFQLRYKKIQERQVKHLITNLPDHSVLKGQYLAILEARGELEAQTAEELKAKIVEQKSNKPLSEKELRLINTLAKTSLEHKLSLLSDEAKAEFFEVIEPQLPMRISIEDIGLTPPAFQFEDIQLGRKERLELFKFLLGYYENVLLKDFTFKWDDFLTDEAGIAALSEVNEKIQKCKEELFMLEAPTVVI